MIERFDMMENQSAPDANIVPEHGTAVSCIPTFADNYVWVIHDSLFPRRVAVVDPGDAKAVREFLEIGELELRAILITHHHSDHTAGVTDLAGAYRVPVYGPTRNSHEPASRPVFEPAGRSISGHQSLEIAGLHLRMVVMQVPGHTIDHVAYTTHDSVFCGDTLFSAGCGRVIEGTPHQMWNSLRRLAALPPLTRVYCAHEYTLSNLSFAAAAEPGNASIARYREECVSALECRGRTLPSTIARELEVNPFLRCEMPALRFAAERFAGRPSKGASDVFSILRGWKDDFKPGSGPRTL